MAIQPSLARMKWIKVAAITLAALIVLAAAVPFFLNFDRFIPQIEQAASDKLKVPVSIKRLRLYLLPVPHARVEGIAIGDAGDLTVAGVKVTPSLFSLLGSTWVIKSIEVDSLVLTQRAIGKIPLSGGSSTSTQQTQQVRIESIRLDNALLKLDKIDFGPFDARIKLDDNSVPEEASIFTLDHKLEADIKPDNSNYAVNVHAKSWTVPAGAPVVFDELTVKGSATLKAADFSEINAKLYGGTVTGQAKIDWQKGLRLSGNLDIDQVELKKIAPLFSPQTHVSGKLSAKPEFSAMAADAGQLTAALRLSTPFNIESGILYGVDIEKAATKLLTRQDAGGETRFDQLAGRLDFDRGNMRFTGLRISSGALAANGDVSVSTKKELSGRVETQIKALGASTTVPLNVAGTVDRPLLYPTGATIGGAAIGTAILGPGVGTAVGAKAGNFVEGLFDKKDQKK